MNDIYSSLIKKIILPVADSFLRTSILSYYNEICNMSDWSKDKITIWQNDKLQTLIQFAYNHTEYYNQLFDCLNIDPNDIRSTEDLERLPILTKKDIIDNYEKLIPDNVNEIKHKRSSTGGSTGDPLKYLLDYKSWSFSNAHTILNWERTTYNYGNKFIALGSSSINVNKKKSLKHSLYYRFKNKISLNGINMSDIVCAEYLAFIKQNKIKYIYGYASAIYLLAKYAKSHKINVYIDACFPTSEILTPLYRETIEQSFNCPIINCYGAHDGGITAFEHQIGFFEVGYNSIVRILDKDANNMGPALLTDLLNYAMPIINYQLGDELQMDENKNIIYSYNGQIINQINGRTGDVIRLENGNVLTGPGFTILFKDLPVEAYSLNKSGYNTIHCKIKKIEAYCKQDEDTIRVSIKKQGGIDCVVELEYIEDFEILKNGKRQYFISD
jgi:phenylacetate-CoA ligase